jgi:hypothetical protein
MKIRAICLTFLALLLCACSKTETAGTEKPERMQTAAVSAASPAPQVISPLLNAPATPPPQTPAATQEAVTAPLEVPSEPAEASPESTEVSPEPMEASPEPTPKPLPVVDYSAYEDLLAKIQQGYATKWANFGPDDLDLSAVFKEPDYFRLGWLQMDVNHDGVDELLFGVNSEDSSAAPIYDIFTILNGSLLSHPAKGYVYSKWFVLPSGQLVNQTTSDGMDRWYGVYGFFNGMLVQTIQPVDANEFLRLTFENFGGDESA